MTGEQEFEAITQCQRLALAFGKHVDYGEAEAAAALFTEDCVFERRGEVLRGRDALVATQRAHGPNRVTRHHCLTPVVTLIDSDTAEGVTYFVLYRHVFAEASPGPAPLSGPEVVGDYVDLFKRTPQGWRISKRVARTVFSRSTS